MLGYLVLSIIFFLNIEVFVCKIFVNWNIIVYVLLFFFKLSDVWKRYIYLNFFIGFMNFIIIYGNLGKIGYFLVSFCKL